LHRHPFYRDRFGYRPEQFPVAEELYAELVSLPLYPKMSDEDAWDVIRTVRDIVIRGRARRSITAGWSHEF